MRPFLFGKSSPFNTTEFDNVLVQVQPGLQKGYRRLFVYSAGRMCSPGEAYFHMFGCFALGMNGEGTDGKSCTRMSLPFSVLMAYIARVAVPTNTHQVSLRGIAAYRIARVDMLTYR